MFATFDDCTSGFWNEFDAAWMSDGCGLAAERALHVLDLVLEEVPAGQRLREERVRDHFLAAAGCAAFADLDVLRDAC